MEYLNNMDSISSRRPVVPEARIEEAFEQVRRMLNVRLAEKGHGSYASTHEALGIIVEELRELEDAIHKNDEFGFREELTDIAVGAIFAIASSLNKSLDW